MRAPDYDRPENRGKKHERIEKLSPELKEVQTIIDQKKYEKAELQKKIKQSEDIKKRCESIRMKGYVK